MNDPRITPPLPPDFDAVIVGAGFAGLYMLHKLREAGFTAHVFEAGDGVGGTWYWNRYPGARCDIESVDYSYSFSPELEQEWQWTERYPRQPEILAYLNHVADRFDLRRDIDLNTRVTAAHFDEHAGLWRIETDRGQPVTARHCVMATGCLSVPKAPELPGIERFAGATYLTAAWPKDGVDFTGLRVGVIGTGSTAIQVIPQVARQAKHLTVFQRTANFSVPARNGPLPAAEQQRIKAGYPDRRALSRQSLFGIPVAVPEAPRRTRDIPPAELNQTLETLWAQGGAMSLLAAAPDVLVDPEANARVAEFVRRKIRATVKDPDLAERLCPSTHPLGTKRLCLDTEYYETFNRDNVTLVDLRATPIETLTEHGLRTREAEYRLDALIFATGFDAMTGALLAMDIRGRNGRSLREAWADGPHTYLGLASAGFPNLFLITGPQSPSVFTNMVMSIEQHVDWIADCLAYLRARGIRCIEASAPAQAQWEAHVAAVADATLMPQADSWYVGANVPGKPRVFMAYLGGLGPYRQRCDEVAAQGYAGFELTPAAATV
ncbi:NAD(P)/FAD-dependent oxidoreductase [Immundisolibacter sp.]|uniref:flavin-containing monooxygenase n=1 Tax=Immundisolibacter sp. TaxID=1934948 RepID=UPI002B0AF500|nr:NAD(P)/FAD-dependent oxidoreductase [Immundisolibacter sp.]MEA3219895.1 Phenylacetone monooxygenase [Immundisolibacter sp.]